MGASMTVRLTTLQRRLPGAMFLIAVAALAVHTPTGAAMLSPALALLAVVWLGLFTGERSVAWLRRVACRRTVRRLAPPMAAPKRPVRTRATGIARAFALAMRPPPFGVAPR